MTMQGHLNTERALRGRNALDAYALGKLWQDSPHEVLTDLLTDLMHTCDASSLESWPGEPIDFHAALRRARDHFEDEKAAEVSP